MKQFNVAIVQASSRSWSGGTDLCMNQMGSKPIITHTIAKLRDYCDRIVVAAPEFDKGGLDFLVESDGSLWVYYGQDESPLLRMVNATSAFNDNEYVLRVNALNFCVDMESAVEMRSIAALDGYDVIRFPENFPALFASDLYSLSALRRLGAMNPDQMFHVHPKYAMTELNGFRSMIYEPSLDRYPDAMLRSVRTLCASSVFQTRIEVDCSRTIPAGDSISFHYKMVLPYLKPHHQVLDMACGSGFGADIMAGSAAKVTGIDIDENHLGVAGMDIHHTNVELIAADCLDTGLNPEQYDCITAFEIIEHVNPNALLEEVCRLLKPGGLCFVSTPQNALGHIPTTPDHVREYSLSGLLDIVSRHFVVEKVIGIKQGIIAFEGDPVGSNSFVVCRKLQA